MRIGRLFLALVLLTGCVRLHVARKERLPPAADAFARQFVQLLAAGDVARATTVLDPVMQDPGNIQGLAAVAATLHGRKLDSLVMVRTTAVNAGERSFYSADYETRAGGHWVVFNVMIGQQPSPAARPSGRPAAGAPVAYTVAGLRESWLAKSLQQQNALTLKGKTPAHYLILLFGLFSVGFILYTLVLVYRARGERRWLWALVCLIAVGNLQMNWTTGQSRLLGIAVVLFGAAVGRPDLASPWIVQVGFPLGAALFHSRAMIHPFWRTRKRESPPEPTAPERTSPEQPPEQTPPES